MATASSNFAFKLTSWRISCIRFLCIGTNPNPTLAEHHGALQPLVGCLVAGPEDDQTADRV